MELLNRDVDHAATSLQLAKGTRILVWDYSFDYPWADRFREILISIDHPGTNFRRVSGAVDAVLGGCGSLRPHLIVIGISSTRLLAGTEVLREMRERNVSCPIIVVTDALSEGHLLQLVDAGASDFLPSPLPRAEVLMRLACWSRSKLDAESAMPTPIPEQGLDQIKGESLAIRSQIEKARRFARSDAAVLISGETGTGKEIFARGIHHTGFRASKPFIAVNCGALPVELIENELFGHEAGAFTGAKRPHGGLIHEAEGGTIFLDEVDSLPLHAQAKLLRFLQQREYRPLGSAEVRQADVRILSASNANLPEAARMGHFRQDLYFRLSVLTLHLPALRDRPEDIPVLANHLLLRQLAARAVTKSRLSQSAGGLAGKWTAFNQHPTALTALAMEKLAGHDWPGNVRELENVIERALAMAAGIAVDAEDIDIPARKTSPGQESFHTLKARRIYELEHGYLKDILSKHGANITRSAKAAQIERRTFFGLLRKHKLTKNSCLKEASS